VRTSGRSDQRLHRVGWSRVPSKRCVQSTPTCESKMNRSTIVTAIIAIVLWEYRFEIFAVISNLLRMT
ncbi:MAG: hypothetical protein VX199_01750, partial [Chloroflexota bacterium]|nr:hypothetical protein [Chloroflexota bacterium]